LEPLQRKSENNNAASAAQLTVILQTVRPSISFVAFETVNHVLCRLSTFSLVHVSLDSHCCYIWERL